MSTISKRKICIDKKYEKLAHTSPFKKCPDRKYEWKVGSREVETAIIRRCKKRSLAKKLESQTGFTVQGAVIKHTADWRFSKCPIPC